MSVIGVPVKVLHEAEGHIVTVETTTGEVSIGNVQYVPRYLLSDGENFNFLKFLLNIFHEAYQVCLLHEKYNT